MKRVILIFSFLGWIAFGRAQIIEWTKDEGSKLIGKDIYVLEDQVGKLNIDQVASFDYQDRFKKSMQSVLHFGFTNSFIWLRFNLVNSTSDTLLLELDHAFIPTAGLFVKDSSGRWQTSSSGFSIAIDQKNFIDQGQIFNLIPGNQTFYLRIKPYVHAIPPVIWEKNKWLLKAAREKFIFGVYAGVLLFMILVNLFLFIALKKAYYLNYAILVLFYAMTSAFVMEGYAVYFFPTVNLMFWYRIVPVLDMTALLFFCISFFEIKKYSQKLNRIAWTASSLFILYIFLIQFIPLLIVLILNQIFALTVFVLAIVIGVTVGRMGNKLGYYFSIAYSIWFMLILVEVIYIQTGVPVHYSAISYVSTGIFIEALLLALLLAKRFQLDKEQDKKNQLLMQGRINQMNREFQNEILNARLEIQEQTFQNISQEIHDNIGQVLSLAKLNLATIDSTKISELEEKVLDSKILVGKAITDLRNMSHSLSSDYVNEMGLISAITYQLEIIKKSGEYETRFSTIGSVPKLEIQTELITFRIVQEALNNILKHAKAKMITVNMICNPNDISLSISDDGVGFNSEEMSTTEKFSLGIKNMSNRASLIGGDLRIKSKRGGGTIVTLNFPLRNT